MMYSGVCLFCGYYQALVYTAQPLVRAVPMTGGHVACYRYDSVLCRWYKLCVTFYRNFRGHLESKKKNINTKANS